jgi:phosphoglycan beta-1,3-galactosyltransferase
VALRTAQRATWMSYQEVARTENNFEGALLPLYVFAAVEPVSGKAPRSRIFDPEALTPSYASLKTATSTLLKEDATGADTYEERRVELRADWREAEETESASPCLRVSSVTVAGGAKSTPLSYLSAALSLPITPAAVAAAEYICHASAALWKEALTHRNVVWIDMMTDRRPTTDKKLGDTTKWGLPVEVGMSQKLVLWLSYAYHAFPNVPYIIKGDDDAYLKVPQFLSDIRYVRTGAVHRDTAPFGRSVMMNAMTAKAELLEGSQPLFETTTTTTTVEPAVLSADDSPECIYWGSMRSFHHIMFNAGMTFMAHRKLVRSVLGPVSLIADRIDIVNLAVGEFDSKKRRVYRSARLHQEDILLGLRIHAAKKHAREVCPGGKVWYIMEGLGRFHDMHRGKMHDVTWSTVVAHRCTPADTYFLHYYFQQEHLLNARGGTNLPSPNSREEEESPEEVEMDVEIRATKQAERWVAAKAESMPANVVGWDALPSVQWSHGEGSVPAYEVYDHDKVAVYHNVYEPWKDRANHVEYGYRAIPLE